LGDPQHNTIGEINLTIGDTVKDYLVYWRATLDFYKGARLMLAGLFLIPVGLVLPVALTVQALILLSSLVLMLLGISVWLIETWMLHRR